MNNTKLVNPTGTETGAAAIKSGVGTGPSNAVFCIAPWSLLHVQAEGFVTPCCESRDRLGNINGQSFSEIWNGPAMTELRARMLRGEPVQGCKKCYDKEASGVESFRELYNRQRRHLLDSVVGSQSDGIAPDPQPLYWDIRFSNICNLRCRSCWHGSSSRWYSDGKAIGVVAGDQAIIHGVKDAAGLFEQLEFVLPRLEEVYFAGGEPLLMEEHYQLLDLLIERGYVNVALVYNTNLSVTGYKERDVLELWNKFDRVTVKASVDGIGARGELIRRDQNWQELVANARRVRSECPRVDFCAETTVSVLNIWHLPDLMRELITLDFAPPGSLITHLLQDPRFYNIRILPESAKKIVRDRLSEFNQWLESRRDDSRERDEPACFNRGQLREIVSYMDSEDWSHLLPEFRARTKLLDKLRSEDTKSVLPELAQLLVQNETASDLKMFVRKLTGLLPSRASGTRGR